jgi:UDP-arabinose 4-epimerase
MPAVLAGGAVFTLAAGRFGTVMGRRVLVTGGAGYIGSHAAKALARAGYEPVVLDNLAQGHRWAVQWGPLIEADLADTERLKQTLREQRVEAVMHFAAHLQVGESITEPRKYFWNNVVNTLRLLDAMLDAGINTLVFSSSAATYGDPQKIPIPEDHPCLPTNAYGDTKLSMERAMHWYGVAYGLRWIALRYFNAAGADPEGEVGEEHDPETHLVPLVIAAALGRSSQVEVFGTDYPTPDGTAIRDYIHIADLAEAHVLALRHLQAGGAGGPLNLGTGSGHSVREVIAAVAEVSGKPVPARDGPRRAGDPPVLVADPTKARATLGWEPRHAGLAEIVQGAWNWHSARAKR